MNKEEIKVSKLRKQNMKIYSLHKMLTADLLFYYSIKILFLMQVKNISMQYIVLGTALYGIFKVVLQIPVTIIMEKIGQKKSIIYSDIIIALSILTIMLCINFYTLLLSYLLLAIGYSLKELAEDGLLANSIPEGENKNNTLSKIYGKGLGNFYYLSALTAVISGFLYSINCYLPMTLLIIVLLISARIACLFNEIEEPKENENIDNLSNVSKEYYGGLKNSFEFIFTSKRLRALFLFGSLMYGTMIVMSSYEMNLMDDINLSSIAIGIIYASMQVITGISAKKQQKFHNKYKNKTLTIIGLSYMIACLIAGLISVTTLPYIVIVTVIVLTYSIRYIDTGLFYVLIKKYISNFSGKKIVNKIYSAYTLVTNIANCIIGIIASSIIASNNIKYALIIFGTATTVLMILILWYMKNRVGLKPKEYKKEDISYKEFIESKKEKMTSI